MAGKKGGPGPKKEFVPEITPEMIEAGLEQYCNLSGEVDREYLVCQVFSAMRRAEEARARRLTMRGSSRRRS